MVLNLHAMDELRTDVERAQYLQNMLIARATGKSVDDVEYKSVRRALLYNREAAELLPGFIVNRGPGLASNDTPAVQKVVS